MLIGFSRTKSIHEHTIYPYVHSLSNIQDRETLLKEIKLPDALPSAIPKDVRFSLVAGDVWNHNITLSSI